MAKHEPRPVGGAGGDRARVRLSQATTAVVRGEDDLTTWDMEELRRGRRRSRNGLFAGRDPHIVPRACWEEMLRRYLGDFDVTVTESLPEAAEIILTLARDEEVDARVRLDAAKYLIERVAGPVTQQVAVSAQVARDPWENALLTAIVGTDAQAAEIIDADVVEEDDEGIQWDG